MSTQVRENGGLERLAVARRGRAVGTEPASAAISPRKVSLLLALAAGVSALLHVATGMQLSSPWIVPDELIYSELAKSIADGSLPSVRGESTLGYGLVYPLVIAPAWGIFDDPANAFLAAKAINAVVMSLATIPAFFLARRFVSTPSALIVAALSAFIPSLLLSGTLLIEVALYPVFLLALLGMVAAFQKPSRRNQLLAVAGIALACLTKPLCVVLAPAYVLAVLHLGMLDRRSGGTVRARLQRHSTALAVLGFFASLAILAPMARGDADALLGVYGVVLGNIDVSGMLVWFVWHLAALDLYVAVIPFAASLTLVALTFVRDVDARVCEFSALAVWTIGGTLAAIAAYSSKPLAGAAGYIPSESRLHERNMFVLVPILLIGLALFVERGRPGSRRLRVGCLSVAAVLPVLLPLERFVHTANFQALTVIPWTAGGAERLWPLTFLPLAAVAVWVTLGAPDRLARRSWRVVALAFVVTSLAAHASMTHPDGGASSTLGIGYDTRWIDHAVPVGAEVMALWVAPGEAADAGAGHRTIWMSEFYNRSVGEVVEVGRPMPYELPHREGAIRDGVLRDVDGVPISAQYLLAPCWVVVDGDAVAGDRRVEALVYRVPGGPVHVSRTSSARPANPACGADFGDGPS